MKYGKDTFYMRNNIKAEKIGDVVEFWMSKGFEIKKTPMELLELVAIEARRKEGQRITKDDWW